MTLHLGRKDLVHIVNLDFLQVRPWSGVQHPCHRRHELVLLPCRLLESCKVSSQNEHLLELSPSLPLSPPLSYSEPMKGLLLKFGGLLAACSIGIFLKALVLARGFLRESLDLPRTFLGMVLFLPILRRSASSLQVSIAWVLIAEPYEAS